MNALIRRVNRLEDQFVSGDGKPEGLLIVASRVGLALEPDTCVEILRECKFLPTGPGFGVVNLRKIPVGLDAGETEKFLRQRGREIRGTSEV